MASLGTTQYGCRTLCIKETVSTLFGVLKRRNPRVSPGDVERVIEEVEDEGPL